MIPDGRLYGDPELGAGQVATIEDAVITTEQAGADVGYGQGVQIKDGRVVPATQGNIYGIAVRRTHLNADHLYEDAKANDKWSEGEWLGVVRDGTVGVPISEDVNSRENAAIDADGNFKPAGANDTVVGVFLSAGNKGGTARLQTRIQLTNTAVTGNGYDNSVDNSADQPANTSSSTASTSSTTSNSGSSTSTKNGGNK